MKFLLLCFCFLFFSFSHSQTKIEGTVTNENKEAIPYANIILRDKEGAMLDYSISNEAGYYSILSKEKGMFFLTFSSLGYETLTFELKLMDDLHEVTKDAILRSKFSELDEVIIEADRSIKIRKDTIVFNAKSFAQGNEQVVEDLLKKIPGLTIDSNGTIKVGNKEVEKVMIEGDDFFERGYKILTKNMPAHPINTIELLRNYSNNRLLKGIEESDKVALNLTLEEDAKRIWFGNFELGYDLLLGNRYTVRGNLMNFGKRNKYYFLTNLNNTGYDATGDIDHLVHPYRVNEPASIGDDQQVHSVVNLSSNRTNFKKSRTNFNNAELLSLNTIFNPTEKLKIKVLGFFNSDEVNLSKNAVERFEVGETNFINTETLFLRNKERTGFGKIDLNYDISETQMIEAVSKINRGSVDGLSDLTFNGNSTIQDLETINFLIDQKISYTNKFREKSVFLFTGRFINEKSPQTYRIDDYLYEGLFSEDENANNVVQNVGNKMQFAGVEGHLIDRWKNGNLLELRLGNQYRQDELDTRFRLRKDQSTVVIPGNFQNRTRYSTNDLYLKAKYHWEMEGLGVNTEVGLHQFINELKHGNGVLKEKRPFYINPSLRLDWEIDKKNEIEVSYSFKATNAEILDVYDNFLLTGFRSFESGTGDFNQLESSVLTLNYQLGEWSDRFFVNTFLVYTKNYDFFSTSSIIEQDYSLSEKTVFKDREYLSVNSNVDRYFKFIRSNLKLDLEYVRSNYKNIVNDSGIRRINWSNFSYGLELRSGFKGLFNYHFGTKWTAYQVGAGSFSNSFIDNASFLDLLFYVNDRFDFQLKGEGYFFGNLETDNRYYFLDFYATYTIKPNKLKLSLDGRNLFDTRNFQKYFVSDIGTLSTSYRLLPWFAVLSLEYRF